MIRTAPRGMRSTALVAGLVAACALFGEPAYAGPRMEIAVSDGAFHDRPRGDPIRNLAYQRARELRATHIRMTLIWKKAPAYDAAYFAMFDDAIDEAVARGFAVDLTITGIASKQYGGADRTGINPDPQQYRSFVSIVANRYRGKVHRYSIWNEPNYLVFLLVADGRTLREMRALGRLAADTTRTAAARRAATQRRKRIVREVVLPANARRYRQLFDLGWGAIKAVDPTAQVMAGELSQTDAFTFLPLMLPKGRTLRADGFALHPYQFTMSPDARATASTSAGISRLDAVQALLRQYHREGRFRTPAGGVVPLYLTEFGYQKKEDRGGYTHATLIPEARRAQWLPLAFERARRAGARQMLYFIIMPTAPGYAWDTSLLDRQGNPLPSFEALRRWVVSRGY
jgi:hypothetical protein